jgi:hypothetical protein
MASKSDLWKKMFGGSESSETKDSRSSKRIAMSVDDPSFKELAEKVEVALRLASIATAKNRESEALLCSSIPIKKEGELNNAMNTAHQEYLAKTKGKKGHGLGGGDTFRFGALMIACSMSDKLDTESKTKINDYIAQFVPESTQAKRVVRGCKTEVMHSSDTVSKLSIPGDPALEYLLVDCVQKIESEQQWFGPRPAGYLEQEAQKLLGNR